MSIIDGQDQTQLRALNARFIHNYVTRDVAGHDAILHRDFIAITSSGRPMSRAAYLAYWATAFDPDVIVYWDLRDERIAIYGNCALVRGTNKHISRQGGQEVTGMTTYTDTYFRDAGHWLCVQAQMTTVTPEFFPGDETILKRYLRGRLVTDAPDGPIHKGPG
jgi:hypothetical protein